MARIPQVVYVVRNTVLHYKICISREKPEEQEVGVSPKFPGLRRVTHYCNGRGYEEFVLPRQGNDDGVVGQALAVGAKGGQTLSGGRIVQTNGNVVNLA